MSDSDSIPVPDQDRLERLSFHVDSGDYFRVVATVLGFVEETVSDCSCTVTTDLVTIETETIQNMRKDLNYLHQHYRIVPVESIPSSNTSTSI